MKLQSSVEFLLTYAWAFMAIAIFLAFLLAVVTTSSPESFNTASCYISPEFTCISSLFSTNAVSSKFIVLFINNVGQPIAFPNNALTVIPSFTTKNYSGYCLPYNALKGATITCTAIISSKISQAGAQINPKFNINYELCSPNCAYPVVAANSINTTGYATLQVSPNVQNPINNVTLLTNPTSGQVFINGIGYPNNNVYIFLSNYQYSIYGSPPNGYVFGNWVVTGGVSVGSATTQSTTAKATALGTLTANFVTTTSSTSTTTASTTSSSSTSTSSTSSTSTTSTSSTSTTSTSTTSTSSSTSTSSTSTSTSTTSTSTSTSTTSTIHYVYCIAGYGFSNTYYSAVQSNGALGSWIASNSYPFAGEAPSCTIYNGYAYCVGGYNSGNLQYQNLVYSSPVSSGGFGAWTSTTAYPHNVGYGHQCESNGGYIYCVGGYDGSSSRTDTYYATLSSGAIGSWTQSSTIPLFGSTYIDSGYLFSINTNKYYASTSGSGISSWTAAGTYPWASTECATYSGYIYCTAGYNGGALSASYYATVSSGGIGTLTATTSYPVAAYAFTCTATGGRIYCVGQDTGGSGTTNVYFAPISSSGIGSWTATTSYPIASRYSTCIST